PADKRRESHLLNKGNFLDPGEKVEAGVPAAFHPLPKGAPTNRLGLAQWLMSRDNPLTARVAVNRLWAQLFGIGIVETEEDFGTQGALPSHRELLDWLAVEFRDGGWDMKAMLKMMVMSAAYQQSSRVTPDLLEKDPRNRLLSRGPRRRLDAEMVRDEALALSGWLSRKEGGTTVTDRVRYGLQLCLARPPKAEQVRTLVELYEKELAHYRSNEADARKLATEPLGPLPEGLNAAEAAAWTTVANVLLNLDG